MSMSILPSQRKRQIYVRYVRVCELCADKDTSSSSSCFYYTVHTILCHRRVVAAAIGCLNEIQRMNQYGVEKASQPFHSLGMNFHARN